MAVRLRYNVKVGVSSSTAEENDIAGTNIGVVVDSQGEGFSSKLSLAVSSTDVQIQVPTLANGKFLYLRTTANDSTQTLPTISLKKNSAGGEAWSVAPLTGAKEAIFMTSTTGITSLYLTNASTSVIVDVQLIVVGD